MAHKANSERLALPEVDIPEPLSWGATPLEVYGRDDITNQQRIVYNELLERTSKGIPYRVPKALREFITANFMARFHERSMRNYESHEARLKKDIDGIDIPFLGVYERAKEGRATPGELLAVRREFGMRSIELAKVTHPYGKNIDYLKPMREAVRKGILDNNGVTYNPRETQKFKLLQSDIITSPSSHEVQYGFAMTRKRLVGEVDDDTRIYERSSFIVRIDKASKFDQKLARKMREVNVINNPTWAEEFSDIGHLDEVVPCLLAVNDFETVIPLSTTTYAYNRTTDRLIEDLNREQDANKPRDLNVERLRKIAHASMDTTQIALFERP